MTREERANRKFMLAGISDNFIFSKTMENRPDLCKQLIEKILGIKISRIEYPEREKVIAERIDSKGVRVDVYVEDDANRIFDLEMQITEEDDLAKRIRYYQGLLDLNKLKRGARYSELSETYIIFICLFDYFKVGRQIYTFRERCEEEINLRLCDGATKIFLNAKGILNDGSEELGKFLRYVSSGKVTDEFTAELDEAVKEIKISKKVRMDYVTLELLIQEREDKAHAEGHAEGLAEGITKGREENKLEMVRKMLSMNMSLENISKISGWSTKKIIDLA